MNIEKNIQKILHENYVAAFAFVDGEKTYQVWMHYAPVSENQIAAISPRSKNHSVMALANPHVSFAILPQQNPGKQPRGLTAQGIMTLIESGDSRIEQLYAQYTKVHGQKQAWYEAVNSDDPDTVNFWVVDVEKFVVYDKHAYPDNARQELKP